MSTSWVVLGLLAALVLYVVYVYNGLVALRQRVNQSFADVDVQLRQRHDLVPNLVETVKGYAAHERGTLEAVVQARNAAVATRGEGGSEQQDAEHAGDEGNGAEAPGAVAALPAVDLLFAVGDAVHACSPEESA